MFLSTFSHAHFGRGPKVRLFVRHNVDLQWNLRILSQVRIMDNERDDVVYRIAPRVRSWEERADTQVASLSVSRCRVYVPVARVPLDAASTLLTRTCYAHVGRQIRHERRAST